MLGQVVEWLRAYQAKRRARKCGLCKKRALVKKVCPACRRDCCLHCLKTHGDEFGPFCQHCHSTLSDVHLSAQLALYMNEEAMKTLRSDQETDDAALLDYTQVPMMEVQTSKMLLSSRQIQAINEAAVKYRPRPRDQSTSRVFLVR